MLDKVTLILLVLFRLQNFAKAPNSRPYEINIYVFTRVNPCIPWTKQGRIEKKMMTIIDEHEAAFFKRPSRTNLTAVGASGTFRAW